MDKSGIFVGVTVGSISVLIIFTALFIIPAEPDETAIQMQNEIDEINNIILTKSETLSLIEIFEKSEPGVVRVNIQRNQTESDVGGVGSGFVFDTQGHIITNAHVVKDATKTVVTFLDGRSYNAEIIGIDQYTDIGVIKVNADLKLLQPLTLGDSSNLQVGEPITAIGNPFGLSGSMTSGIISQIGRLLPSGSGYSIPDVIQTDAAINPGNSGGALLNHRGNLIGMNTKIFSKTGSYAGIGFALPSNKMIDVASEIVKYGKVQRSWIGDFRVKFKRFLLNDELVYGLEILEFKKYGPLYEEGEIDLGSIIISINNQVASWENLTEALKNSFPGDKITIEILHDNQIIEKELVTKAQGD